MQTLAIVIFGAAVQSDGRPSPTLSRRIDYALHAARSNPSVPILCSEAAGRVGPSEASVIAGRLADAGVEGHRLVLDEASRDTLQSVVAAARFVRQWGLAGCLICSDGYHVPRIRMLLAALGVATETGPVQPNLAGTSLPYWIGMRLREALAIPYDLSIILMRRRAFLARVPA